MLPSPHVRRAFADQYPELLRTVLEHVRATDVWARQHRDEIARYLGPLLGIEERAIQLSVARASWGLGPITEATLGAQQRIADVFHELGLLSAPLRIRDALPKSKAF